MKWLLVVVFVVRIIVPMSKDVVIKDVEKVTPKVGYYELILTDGRLMYVSMLGTVIEEEKSK